MRETLKQELDFVNEGHNGERCAKELKHLSYVYVPEVHWDLTSKVAPGFFGAVFNSLFTVNLNLLYQ